MKYNQLETLLKANVNMSSKTIKKHIDSLVKKGLLIKIEDEYFTLEEFVDYVNKHNENNPENQIGL